jgi:predicted DNA-binding protein (UPF0251 family)
MFIILQQEAIMPRPPVCRHVLQADFIVRFSPEPGTQADPVLLTLDELEAIRLADVLGYYQDRAAEQMQVSRATFSRIVERARRKVGEALLQKRTLLVIDSAPVTTYEKTCACGCRRRRHMARAGDMVCPLHPEKKENES